MQALRTVQTTDVQMVGGPSASFGVMHLTVFAATLLACGTPEIDTTVTRNSHLPAGKLL